MKFRSGLALLFLLLPLADTPAGEDARGPKDALAPSSRGALQPSPKATLAPSPKSGLLPSAKSAKTPLSVTPPSSPGRWLFGAGLSWRNIGAKQPSCVGS